LSHRTEKIAAAVKQFEGKKLSPYYLGYFHLFNQQLYFEAHEVLEQLWLPCRKSAEGEFYKGLIQLAGAFVHLQKHRPGPAASLFKLARGNLQKYPENHLGLDLKAVLQAIEHWLSLLNSSETSSRLLKSKEPPMLRLPDT
jgi:predicted metal-dependent hydrolase